MKRIPRAGTSRTQKAIFSAGALGPLCLCAFLLFAARAALAQETRPGPPAAPDKSRADALLAEGVQAFKRNDFAAAMDLFQKATEADPASAKAHVYLATAKAHTYIPGDSSDENEARGRTAIAEFRTALEMEPENILALEGLGALLFHMARQPYDRQKLMESRSVHYRHAQLKPEDPEPQYWIALIDWVIAFHGNTALRAEYNQTANPPLAQLDPLPPPLVDQFREQYGWLVDDGIVHAQKAIELRPDYADALANLNLLYRQKADQCPSEDERANYLQAADGLVEQVVKLKKQKAAGSPAQ